MVHSYLTPKNVSECVSTVSWTHKTLHRHPWQKSLPRLGLERSPRELCKHVFSCLGMLGRKLVLHRFKLVEAFALLTCCIEMGPDASNMHFLLFASMLKKLFVGWLKTSLGYWTIGFLCCSGTLMNVFYHLTWLSSTCWGYVGDMFVLQ